MRYFHGISKAFSTSIATALIGMALLITFFSAPLNAAYCSLRDPVIAINALYPDSEGHRSIVRPISQETRQLISNELPFTLHFNEIGKHTLYVAHKENQTIGFVHARSELSKNGIIEIAWAINLDMSVNGFFFQRCRLPECNGSLPQQLSQHLKGKSFDELLQMLDKTSANLIPSMQLQYGTKSDLVLSIIRSALKTISVTQKAWREDIDKIRRQEIISKYFGPLSTTQFQSHSGLTAIVESPNYTILQPGKVKNYAVLSNKKIIGYLAEASWKQGQLEGITNWLFSTTGKLLDIQATRKWPNEEVKTAFQEVIGKDFSMDTECASAVEFAGKSLYLSLLTTHKL